MEQQPLKSSRAFKYVSWEQVIMHMMTHNLLDPLSPKPPRGRNRLVLMQFSITSQRGGMIVCSLSLHRVTMENDCSQIRHLGIFKHTSYLQKTQSLLPELGFNTFLIMAKSTWGLYAQLRKQRSPQHLVTYTEPGPELSFPCSNRCCGHSPPRSRHTNQSHLQGHWGTSSARAHPGVSYLNPKVALVQNASQLYLSPPF